METIYISPHTTLVTTGRVHLTARAVFQSAKVIFRILAPSKGLRVSSTHPDHAAWEKLKLRRKNVEQHARNGRATTLHVNEARTVADDMVAFRLGGFVKQMKEADAHEQSDITTLRRVVDNMESRNRVRAAATTELEGVGHLMAPHRFRRDSCERQSTLVRSANIYLTYTTHHVYLKL